jgi:UDP-glucuronate decarboxylase
MPARQRADAIALMPERPVLVAGGAGFLGSHLCERLLRDGRAVLCADDFTTGSRRNVEAFRDASGFRLLEHDVITPLRVDTSFVVNLACPASPVHYQAQPIRTTRTSVEGTYNLLAVAEWAGVPLLQASTSEVYGEPQVHPQPEHYWGHVNSTGIRSCYDEGKRCAESLCFDFNRRHGVPVKVARIFNTYGPRMQVNDGRVVSNFLVQALRNDPITIYGNGSQTRSFCYVDDLIEAFVRFMRTPADVVGPINLGNPEEYTVRDLAEKIIELTGSRSKIVERPLPSDDPTQRRPDIAQAESTLGWRPRVPLMEGLRRTAEYFDEQLALEATTTRPRAVAVSGARVQGAAVNGVNGNAAHADLVLPITPGR